MPDRAVFLDRDNTLIDNDGDLGDPERVRLLEGVAPALARLREARWRLVVVSNQGGVARGVFSEADADAVNRRVADLLDDAVGRRDVIERFYYCPYHPEGTIAAYTREHPWRKPQPGMIHAAQRDLDLDLGRSWLVGDQVRDVAAGQAAGVSTILITGDDSSVGSATPTAVVRTIGEAVDIILKSET
ncbi:MAG: D-glycero-alpha-D-manno-heptose-1,7-bisphosphate 7-phosphatase [Planctomycetota bacterium]|jgi:D-glycero-D-manno-heptose 1,7-bisphosphate phosphatase